MKSPVGFIARPEGGVRYKSKKGDFFTSASIEDFKATNRIAVVEEVPMRYDGPVKIGDKLLVHHNVFRFYNNTKREKTSSSSLFRDGTFIINQDQMYAWYDGEKWNAYDRFCLVKPIPLEESDFIFGTKEQPLTGEMWVSNSYLESYRIYEGTKVVFKPESEVEYVIDAVKVYRMTQDSIVGIIQ